MSTSLLRAVHYLAQIVMVSIYVERAREDYNLTWLRQDRGLPACLSREEMSQSGWTETVDASEIDLPTIWAKVEALSKVKT